MVTAAVFDFTAAALIFFAAADGKKRGLFKLLWRVGSWILTAVLAMAVSAPFSQLLADTPAARSMCDKIEKAIESRIGNPEEISLSTGELARITGIPETLIPEEISDTDIGAGISGSVNEAAKRAAHEIARKISDAVLKVLTGISLILLLKIAAAVLYNVFNTASRLPVISGANSFLGAVLGVINILFVIYAALAVVSLCIKSGSEWEIYINNTFLVKFFYNNNILLRLIK